MFIRLKHIRSHENLIPLAGTQAKEKEAPFLTCNLQILNPEALETVVGKALVQVLSHPCHGK